MRLKGKRIAMFVAAYFEDLEFWYPLYRMKEEGAEVTVIGPKREIYHGKHELPATADVDIKGARAELFDALLIPGGYSPDHMRRAPGMVEFVQKMHGSHKLIAAICHAGWMLASADIIEGRRVTSFFSIKDDMVHAGGLWEDSEVVRDGNIITSRKPDDLPAYCRSVIDALSG